MPNDFFWDPAWCVLFTAHPQYNLADMDNFDRLCHLDDLQDIQIGEILPGEIPGGKVVSSVHKGPYKEMEQPYMEMVNWISDNGYEPTGVAYEYYYNSPEEVPESELLTRIVMPVK